MAQWPATTVSIRDRMPEQAKGTHHILFGISIVCMVYIYVCGRESIANNSIVNTMGLFATSV